ncbi:DMT family transporter [Salinibius halmophilus]|uniref:DMT family transporter n=1 Tax=Salinibius halmophilus TaxID=1853216 RepID=UPI000E675C93|nr:DMT family transporter [Salinibius halmophilus]
MAWFYLISAMVFWASSFVAFKWLLGSEDGFVIVFWRLLIAGLVTLPIVMRAWRKRPLSWSEVGWFALLSLFEPCLYFVFEAQALKYTTSGQAALIIGLLPVAIAITSWVLFKERLAAKTWAGLLLAVVGVCLVTLFAQTSELASNPVLGNLLQLGAVAVAVGYTLLLKRLVLIWNACAVVGFQSLFGAAFFLPVLLISDKPMPSADSWLGIVYLGLLVSVLAYSLYGLALKYLSAAVVGAFVNLIPVLTLIMGWLLLAEALTLGQVAGVVLVLLGLILTTNQESAHAS